MTFSIFLNIHHQYLLFEEFKWNTIELTKRVTWWPATRLLTHNQSAGLTSEQIDLNPRCVYLHPECGNIYVLAMVLYKLCEYKT